MVRLVGLLCAEPMMFNLAFYMGVRDPTSSPLSCTVSALTIEHLSSPRLLSEKQKLEF